MPGCSIQIEIGNQTLSFNSQQELDDFILNNLNRLNSAVANKNSNVRFSKTDQVEKGEEIFAKLLDLKASSSAAISYEIDGTKYEVPKTVINKKGKPNIKGVTSFISGLKVNDRLIFTPFDQNNYIVVITDKLTRQYMGDGMTEADARQKAISEVDKQVKSWPMMSGLGTEVHTVASIFFDSNTPDFNTFRQLYAKQLEGDFHKITPIVLEQLYNTFSDLKDHFIKYSGDPNIKFLTEVPILDEESGIVGIIDLVAVDTKGNTYLGDFKTSFKYVDDQDRDKLKKYGYQLAFYKRLMESIGSPVLETTIIPIKLNDVNEDFTKITSIEVEPLQNMGIQLTNPTSDEFLFAKNNIKAPELESLKFESSGIIESEQKSFFNISSDEDLKIQYDQFLARELRKEGDKQFFWKEGEGRVYLKEIKPNPSTQEEKDANFLNQKINEGLIKEYIQTSNSSKYETVKMTKNALNRMIATGDYISLFGGTNTSSKAAQLEANAMNTFSHYTNGAWSILDMPELEAQGVIAFKNDISNYVDFVAISYRDVNQLITLTKGTNLLGEFRSDKQMLKEAYALESSVKNHMGIKILSVLNNNVDLLKSQGLTINNIQVFNYKTAQQVPINKDNLLKNYKILQTEVGGPFNLNGLKFTTSEQELLSAITIALRKDKYSGNEARVLSTLNAVLGATHDSESGRIDELKKVKRQFETDFNINFRENLNFNTDLGMVYGFLNSMITEMSSNRVQYENKDMVNTGLYNSSLFSSFHEVQSRVARIALMPIRTAMDSMAENYIKVNNEFRPIFKKFYEAKGVSVMLGNHQQSFSNLFERNNDGSIDKNFRFKNPESNLGNNDYLDIHEREFLNAILPELGRRMYGDIGIANAKQTGDYYNVPLKRAGETSKVLEAGVTGLVQQPKMLFSNMVNSAMEEAYLFEEQRAELIEMSETMSEMYNKFNVSKSPGARQQLIDATDNIEFEKNVELIFADVVFTDLKVNAYNNALPIVTATLVSSMMQQRKFGNHDLEKTYQYIRDNIKSTVYDEKLIEDNQRAFLQKASTVKHAVSMLQLGASPLNVVRETLQGQWATISKLAAKQYGDETPSLADYKWALGRIVGEGEQFLRDVTMTEELNHFYRLANMDTNQLAEKMVISKTGLTQLSNRWWLWFMGAPDYINRMGFFLAKLKKDGAYDAHSMVDGKLVYDWTKDARFEIYAKGDTNNPKYTEQRGRYLAYLNQFNKEARQKGELQDLFEGDALPKAYPTIERESIKSFVNYMHGPYDQEDKIMFHNTMFGVMMLQFKTWLLAKKQQYVMKGDEYSIGEFKQMIDPSNNKPIFVSYDENGDATQNTDGEGVPLYDWQGRYMEGVLNSFWRVFKEAASGDLKGTWDLIRNDKNVRSNAIMSAMDLSFFTMISLMLPGIIPWDDLEENKILTSTLQSITQSAQDLWIWNNIKAMVDPDAMFPSVSFTYDTIEGFFKTITGDMGIMRFIAKSSGLTRFLDKTSNLFEIDAED